MRFVLPKFQLPIKRIKMQLLFILTLINAVTHSSMAKGIKHDVASTHAKVQLSDATSGATNGAFFLILYFFPPF
jgi:hypothetical protein